MVSEPSVLTSTAVTAVQGSLLSPQGAQESFLWEQVPQFLSAFGPYPLPHQLGVLLPEVLLEEAPIPSWRVGLLLGLGQLFLQNTLGPPAPGLAPSAVPRSRSPPRAPRILDIFHLPELAPFASCLTWSSSPCRP